MSRAKLNFFLNNQQVDPPANWQGISMTLDFNNDGDGPFTVQPEISTDSLEFVLNSSGVVRQWVQDGIAGSGPGIYEPMELRIELASGGSNTEVFNGLLDMVNDMQFIDKNKVLVKIIKKGGVNQLAERAQAISFAFLFARGEITSADFVRIRYVQAHIPDFREILIISLAIFVLVKEISERIKRVIDLTVDIVTITVGGGLTGGLGAILLLAGRTLTEIAYTVLIIIALKELITDLINNLVAKQRIHLGMRLSTLLQKGAAHLGYTFESSEFNSPFFNGLTILPVKEKAPSSTGAGETGFPTNKGGLYTYFEMLQFYKQLINGKIVVRGNKIIIERRDFFDNPTNFKLPDVKLDEFRYNAEEIQGNLNIQFLIDEKDHTTLLNYEENNTTFQRITEPKIVNNAQNVQIKGLESVNLPVSLPNRKTKLTSVEKVLLDVARLVDTFIGGNFFSNKITGRFGVLHLGNDFTGVPKLVPIAVEKVSASYLTIMSAKVLHDNYYFINSFTPVPVNHNQFRRHVRLKIPFCFEDYITLSENPGFTTANGEEGVFEKIEGHPDSGSAEVDIRIKDVFTTNLKDRIA